MNFAKAIAGLFASSHTQSDADVATEQKFAEHCSKFGLSFGTQEEYAFRLDIFAANEKKIQEINAEPENTFTVGHNMMSHLTEAEYAQWKGKKDIPHLRENRTYEDLDESYPSATVDWREKGVVSPVQNQARCGSCWAFSSTAAIESAHAIKTGNLLKLAEQQFVDCDPQSDGCDGGLETWAFEYAEKNSIELEKDYPYTGTDGSCQAAKSLEKVGVTDFTPVKPKSVAAIKAAVAKQPTCVSVDASGSAFQLYTSGILNAKHCGTSLDHAVTAVGYGTEDGLDYLIVRNSWTSGWGEDGHIRIAIPKDGAGVCGILLDSVRPTTD